MPFTFDVEQQVEIALTIAQSVLALTLLIDMRFRWYDAAGLFALWLIQFLVPAWRYPLCLAYIAWAAVQIGLFVVGRERVEAPRVFLAVLRANRARRRRAT